MFNNVTVYLASTSEIKLRAVRETFGDSMHVVACKCATPTPTPQPLSRAEALECADVRMTSIILPAEVATPNGKVLLAFENFIERDSSSSSGFVDRCLVLMQCEHTRVVSVSPIEAIVPALMAPIIEADLTPSGVAQRAQRRTIGERLAAYSSTIIADDWFVIMGSPFPRAVQIAHGLVDVSMRMRLMLNGGVDNVVRDFPKPGVDFVDIFADPLAVRPLVDGMLDQLRFHRVLDLAPITFVGLDSRGLALAYALAYAVPGAGFVPVRKAGKLPGAVIRKQFAKEYGDDALEVQSGGNLAGRNVIVVDDILATGGSMAAACELLEQAGAKIQFIVCLRDVSPLRAQWKAKLLPKYRVALAAFT